MGPISGEVGMPPRNLCGLRFVTDVPRSFSRRKRGSQPRKSSRPRRPGAGRKPQNQAVRPRLQVCIEEVSKWQVVFRTQAGQKKRSAPVPPPSAPKALGAGGAAFGAPRAGAAFASTRSGGGARRHLPRTRARAAGTPTTRRRAARRPTGRGMTRQRDARLLCAEEA